MKIRFFGCGREANFYLQLSDQKGQLGVYILPVHKNGKKRQKISWIYNIFRKNTLQMDIDLRYNQN